MHRYANLIKLEFVSIQRSTTLDTAVWILHAITLMWMAQFQQHIKAIQTLYRLFIKNNAKVNGYVITHDQGLVNSFTELMKYQNKDK